MFINYQAVADTIGTSNYNYFNGLGNMFLARSQSQNMQMWNAMQSCWTGFMPYGNLSGMAHLTDPRYTIGQMTWGTPMWNGNPWTMDFGMVPPWGNPSGTQTTKKPETAEEKAYQKKFNVLLSLLKQVKKYPDLLSTQKELIDDAINDAKKGTYEEKYNTLLTAYKAIDKEALKDFFTVADKLGATSDIKENSKSDDSFQNRLKATGHEMDTAGQPNSADDIIEDLYSEIELLSDADATSNLINGDLTRLALNQVNILDLISSWNSVYKNKEESSRLLGHIMEKHDDLEDEDSKHEIRTVVVTPIVTALVKEAEKNLKDLTSDSKRNMNNAIENLEKALEEYEEDGANGEQVCEAFDNLYVLTRLVATEKLEHGVVDYYSRIEEGTDIEDTDKVFKNGMFTDSMIADLKAEGFDSEDIQKAKETVQRRNSTAEADEVDETDEADEADETNNDETPAKPTKNEEMEAFGLQLATSLKGCTDSRVYTKVNAQLGKVNKNNVMSLLEGYYEKGDRLESTEGLIEKLDDEYDDGAITMNNKKKVINSLIELAESKGLTTNEHYIALKDMSDAYKKDPKRKNRDDFNHGGWSRIWNGEGAKKLWGTVSAGIGAGAATYAAGSVAASVAGGATLSSALGAFFTTNPVGWVSAGCLLAGGAIWGLCDTYTDNEFIDDHMEALYQDLKALEQ